MRAVVSSVAGELLDLRDSGETGEASPGALALCGRRGGRSRHAAIQADVPRALLAVPTPSRALHVSVPVLAQGARPRYRRGVILGPKTAPAVTLLESELARLRLAATSVLAEVALLGSTTPGGTLTLRGIIAALAVTLSVDELRLALGVGTTILAEI